MQISEICKEQEDYQDQLAEVIQDLKKKENEKVVPIPEAPIGTLTRVVYKISKAPKLPKFSGGEQTLREEQSIEQRY